MKFLCLGYYNAAMDSRPSADIEAIMSQCRPLLQGFYATGQVLMDAGLDPPAKRLRNVNGAVRVEDSVLDPRAAAIGSATIIEAPDLDGAVALASKHPSPQVAAGAAFGWTLEIRPIHSFHGPDE